MEINPTELDEESVYKLFMGCIVPRPIAWVSSVDLKGVVNLAPFSFFTGLSHYPPMLGISVGGSARKKDTLLNIEQTKEFAVNIVTARLAQAMNITAMNCGPEINEFELAGLKAESCRFIKAPRVKDSPISMECKLVTISELPGTNYHFVIGKVVNFHISDSVLESGEIKIQDLHPVARLSAHWYSELGRLFEMSRPKAP